MIAARTVLARGLHAAVLVLVSASAAFLLGAAAPGDAVRAALPFGSQQELDAARAAAGLDRPLLSQYASWLGSAMTGDLGTSLRYRVAVAPMVLDRALNTAVLAAAALALALAIGLPPAVLVARRPAAPLSRLVQALSLALLSVPPFVGALVLVLVAARTGWLPAGGMASDATLTGAAWLADRLWHLPVPALALALPLAATFERQQARALAEALGMPAVQAARARGVPESRILLRHAWRVSLKPIAALGGLAMASLLGGAFVVETIAAWPGLGRLTYDAFLARDLPLIAGCALAGSAALALGVFVSDLMVAWADPRSADEQTGAATSR